MATIKQELDFVTVRRVFCYDADSGDVLSAHEVMAETVDGKACTEPGPEPADIDAAVRDTARLFPGRKIAAMAAPGEFVPRDNARYRVDPATKAIEDIGTPVDLKGFMALQSGSGLE